MRHVKRLIMRVLLNKYGSRTKFYKNVNKKLSYRMNNCYIVINSGRGALFAAGVSQMEGGVERKLSLGLVRSFFALSIGDNIRFLSLPCLGGYHWLRTRRLLRLQKANSSLAPLPLLRLFHCSTGRGRARCPTAPRRREDTPPYLMMGLADETSG